MTLRWDHDGERWIAWHGPVLMGSVAPTDEREWEAWALGSTSKMRFKRLPVAQAWVEKRAES